ncbi:hypothetical protein P6B95_01010 [Streptomyces atratus]|uniref:hypothetical protein n=1 Tax=Streptomyces atratus TaxID=1893 RepID=UPI002AC32BE1|nr:hypothetical protein [Streptomyces atratus]WPW26185.1 hypothetical protein P6B95_01010 [Streptomyces atratus]
MQLQRCEVRDPHHGGQITISSPRVLNLDDWDENWGVSVEALKEEVIEASEQLLSKQPPGERKDLTVSPFAVGRRFCANGRPVIDPQHPV